jgi:hypothetical protein
MKVYFSCSTAEFTKYKSFYYAIRQFILDEGHILTRDWLPLTDEKLKGYDRSLMDIHEVYKENMLSLKEADMLIVEDTISNFSTGHQITVALQDKKPTLVLWQNLKPKFFKSNFIEGIDSEFLQISEYTTESLKDIIRAFINKYENVHEKNRFHLVLNTMERNYLDWAQFIKDKSRTKVIKEALKKEIDSDIEYNAYLRDKTKIEQALHSIPNKLTDDQR